MLIEFSVTNFRSIKDTQTLKMTANKGGKLSDNSFDSGLRGLPQLLSSVAMYGPNAAGKTSFIKAISFMKQFILGSSKNQQEGEDIKVEPFKFDAENRKSPSEFEVIFIKDNVRYQYGFSVTSKRVVSEWLLAYPAGRSQRWFQRDYNSEVDSDNWYFGSKLHGKRKVWAEATRDNALFLSTAVQLKSVQLKPVFDWFQKDLHIVSDSGFESGYTLMQCKDEDAKKRIIDFMNAADFSISDIRLKEDVLTLQSFPADMPKSIREEILEEVKDKKFINVELMHPSTCGSEQIPIDLDEESSGTQKFFSFAGPWLDVIEEGSTLFVDELDNSLHPLMVRFLVGLFQDPLKNKNKAQLIFTTHDTSILDKEFLRRDQIWFFEKNNKSNFTNLYPLTDFRPRDSEALEKGYLQGRYGALPFFGSLDF